jgi:dihydrofolate reductase
MKAIVAVDQNWGIGCGGSLLQWIPEDMNFFKQMTLGKIVIMGRTTFESLPAKQPLRDRKNIVLSRGACLPPEKMTLCRSLEALFQELKKYDADDAFVIGGESVYSQLLPYCTEAYVTKIENEYQADKHFVNLDKIGSWKLAAASERKSFNNVQYRFLRYVNQSISHY